MRYILVCERLNDFDVAINRWLETGWELYGSPYGLTIEGIAYHYQALIKKNK